MPDATVAIVLLEYNYYSTASHTHAISLHVHSFIVDVMVCTPLSRLLIQISA